MPGDLLVPLLAAVAIFVVAGAAQATTGFGSAMAAVPLLTLVVEPLTAVVASVTVSALITALAWIWEAPYVDSAATWRLSISGLLGMPLGLLALALLAERTLVLMIAAIVMLLVAALAADVRVPAGPAAQAGAGIASGALLTSTSMNGPPLVLVLQGARLAPREFRATLQAVFCVQSLLAIAAFAVLGHIDATVAAVTVGGWLGVPLGWSIGDKLFHRLDAVVFRRVVLAGLVLSAVVAVAGAW